MPKQDKADYRALQGTLPPAAFASSAAFLDAPQLIPFVKMQCGGNDFVIFDARYDLPFSLDAATPAICHRQFGIGADACIALETSRSVDFRMVYINADGSPSDMCGNGLLCLGKYVYERGLVGRDEKKIEFEAGSRRVLAHILSSADQVRITIGEPVFDSAAIPFARDETRDVWTIRVGDRDVEASVLSFGNPHCVLQVDNLEDAPVHELGSALERHSLFPEGTNVEFVKPFSRSEIGIRIWERGVGETLACGSGICAAAVALMRDGRIERDVQVHSPGGAFTVSWRQARDGVRLTASPALVFRGECSPHALMARHDMQAEEMRA